MKGLALSGGGMKAAAHIGALKALEEKNIKFECISGTSSGSIIATMYALGFTSDEMYEMFNEYCKKIKYIEPKNIFKIIWGLLFKRTIIVNGLNSGEVIEELINDICNTKGIKNIKQIKMPLLIPMVDLQTGEIYIATSKEVRRKNSDKITYITDMPIGKAVRASCSYPAIFSPLEYYEKQLIDGGIRENLPWKELKKFGAEEVMGICFESILGEQEKHENLVEVAARSLELVCHELSIYEKEGIDRLITIPLKKNDLLDYTKNKELYNIGYEFMKKELEN